MAAKVDGQMVTLLRQASETSQLYGSVNPRDVAVAFTEAGITLERQQVRLEQPLKTLGLHDVIVALHPEVEVTVKVNIARSQAEADLQSGKAARRNRPRGGARAHPRGRAGGTDLRLRNCSGTAALQQLALVPVRTRR